MAVFFVPVLIATDSDGNRVNGAKLYSRESGSTTPTATYSDAALSTAHANPVVADANGVFPAIYLDPDTNYRFILTDGSDAGNDPDQETELWQDAFDDYQTQAVDSYDYTIAASGAVGSDQVYLGPMAVRSHQFPDDFAGSLARLETAPSAEIVFDIQINDSSVGSITFANASQSGVFSSSGSGVIDVTTGDYIDIVAPSTTNSAAGLRATFKGTYVR